MCSSVEIRRICLGLRASSLLQGSCTLCMKLSDMTKEGEEAQRERPTLTTVVVSNDGSGVDRGKNLVSGEKKGSLRFADEQLLPGIPNDITLDHICPKLPWRAFRILSPVSRAWRKQIQDYELYDARVRSHSTERFVVLSHSARSGGFHAISLYSTRGKACYRLPPIPGLNRGVPRGCQCVSLNGKIYVLGGEGDEESNGVEVYVLDLAGQREWGRCADMQQSRKKMGCGVLDGKIYVCGGIYHDSPVLEAEVYDPTENSWSSIAPMKTPRVHHQVVAKLGKELAVFGGSHCDTHFHNQFFWDVKRDALFFEVYHPRTDQWVVSRASWTLPICRVFVAGGSMHMMTSDYIFVRDRGKEEFTWKIKHSWKRRHSFKLPHFLLRRKDCARFQDFPVLAVNDELWTISEWFNENTETSELCLLESKGFGSKKKELEWEKADCSVSFSDFLDAPFLCAIEL